MGALEIGLILLALVLLFGAKKLPAMARSVGQSMRIFKAETKGMRKDKDEESNATAAESTEADATSNKTSSDPQQLPPAQESKPVAEAVDNQQKQNNPS
nr:Sec-independent protein translocase subunit TatA [Tamaricihabitans halophyticus]